MSVAAPTEFFFLVRVPMTCLHVTWNKKNWQNISELFPNPLSALRSPLQRYFALQKILPFSCVRKADFRSRSKSVRHKLLPGTTVM